MASFRLVGLVVSCGAVGALFAACGDGGNTIIIVCDDAGTCPGIGAGGMNSGSGGDGSGGTPPGSGGMNPGSGGDGSGGSPPGSGGSPPGSGGSPPGSGGSPPGSGGTPDTGGTAGSGGAPPTGTVFFDNFDDGNADGWLTDNVGPVGSPPGIWSVIGGLYNQSVANSTESTSRITYVSGSWTDMTVEARAKMNFLGAQTSSFYVGVCGRYLDNNNYICGALRHDGQFSLRARINGNTSTLGAQVDVVPPVTTGVWYTVKVQFQGSTVSGYLDGALLTTDVAEVASGGIALITAGTTADYDDVVVTVP